MNLNLYLKTISHWVVEYIFRNDKCINVERVQGQSSIHRSIRGRENDYFGDDFTSCIEDFLINLINRTVDCPELDMLKLGELEAPSQNGVDLKLGLDKKFLSFFRKQE